MSEPQYASGSRLPIDRGWLGILAGMMFLFLLNALLILVAFFGR